MAHHTFLSGVFCALKTWMSCLSMMKYAEFAAARYAKALRHFAKKCVDLSLVDIAEVHDVKLTLNLNLASAYLKVQNPDQTLRYSNAALAHS